MADPCRAHRCECPEYAPKNTFGGYDHCLECGHTSIIHYTPSTTKQKRVKR